MLYLADQEADGRSELYHTSLTIGGAVKVNPELPYLSGVDSYELSSDGQHVVYNSDQNVYQEAELFSRSFIDEELCFPVKAKNGNFAIICF